MMNLYLSYVLSFGLAFALSVSLTPVVRWGAIRFGQVAKPRNDRWHTRPTALMGGVAIVAAFCLAAAVTAVMSPAAGIVSKYLPLFLCALLVSLLGLIDDIYHLSPYRKHQGHGDRAESGQSTQEKGPHRVHLRGLR